MFFIGAIHNENQLFTEQITALQSAVRGWLANDSAGADCADDGDRIDCAYLAAVHAAYKASVDQWAGRKRPAHKNWSVWGRFLFLLDKLGLDLTNVAFTNLAQCFTNSDNSPFLKACLYQVDHNGRRLSYPHPYWSALQTLIEGLAPLAVFVQQSSDLTRPLMSRLKIPEKIWQFDNRTGALFQADGKPKILWSENWWLKAVTDYKETELKYPKPGSEAADL